MIGLSSTPAPPDDKKNSEADDVDSPNQQAAEAKVVQKIELTLEDGRVIYVDTELLEELRRELGDRGFARAGRSTSAEEMSSDLGEGFPGTHHERGVEETSTASSNTTELALSRFIKREPALARFGKAIPTTVVFGLLLAVSLSIFHTVLPESMQWMAKIIDGVHLLAFLGYILTHVQEEWRPHVQTIKDWYSRRK